MANPKEVLQNEFHLRRERNPNLSLRSFARWLGISPAQISQVMSGKRRLTPKMAGKIARRLDLSPLERLEFVQQTNQDFIENVPLSKESLNEERFQLIAEWYHFAILSLTKTKGANSDPRWIAQRLGITVSEARTATERLVKLELLQLKPFKQIGSPLVVAPGVPSTAIRRHHKQLINRALETVDTEPTHRRQIHGLTFATDAKHVAKAEKYIEQFLDQMDQMLECAHPTDVYTLNLQLSPLTKNSGETK